MEADEEASNGLIACPPTLSKGFKVDWTFEEETEANGLIG